MTLFCLLKEKRIYDLKKKNQELEKFKFVLDYKIKELKKQIEPRENDIKAMKEQIQEVRRRFVQRLGNHREQFPDKYFLTTRGFQNYRDALSV